jgi:DNA-binding XRE family transcriptional regulator
MQLATETAHQAASLQLDHLMHVERVMFAAKVRTARAVLGLSQDQFAKQVGLTQKSVHRIEQADVQPKLRTILMIEQFWSAHGISFENLRSGGFRLVVETSVLLHD